MLLRTSIRNATRGEGDAGGDGADEDALVAPGRRGDSPPSPRGRRGDRGHRADGAGSRRRRPAARAPGSVGARAAGGRMSRGKGGGRMTGSKLVEDAARTFGVP